MIRRFALAWALIVALCLAIPTLASGAPQPVAAWYMFATTSAGLKAEAYSHGKHFAETHPGGDRLLLLDFGAARKVGSSTWGAVAFGSPSTAFSNPEILAALKVAADGVHDGYVARGYVAGPTTIAYGNSNYHMSSSGMTLSDAYYAGYYQSSRVEDLSNYQYDKNYDKQAAAAASDIEPSWETAPMSRKLVDGVAGQGWALIYDFGSADGCPSSGSGGSCNNGWTVADVAYVSFSGSAVPLPEIYYTVNADQWTTIKRSWDNSHYLDYIFWGTTAEVATGVLTPAQGWNALSSRNSGAVLPEIVCFGW